MVFVIPKKKIPMLSYTPVPYKDEIAMIGIDTRGAVILYTATDEIIFCPWDEVVSYSATAKREKVEEEPDEKPTGTVREVKPSKER